jgi:hypothetical protein
MSDTSTILFWGDNGVHEFWEDADRIYLILRNHGEQSWSAHHNHGFLFFCPSAQQGASRLKLTLAVEKRWVEHKGKFVLTPTVQDKNRK